MPPITRSDEEIDAVLDEVVAQKDKGGSRWPGMSYEDGVDNALRWARGESDDNPMED